VVILTVSDKPAIDEEAREVIVKPISGETASCPVPPPLITSTGRPFPRRSATVSVRNSLA